MASTKKITVKLVVDKKANRVLFAEAKKDFVDFLISLLSLPLASVTQVLSRDKLMVGSLGELYESVDKLDNTYIQSSMMVLRKFNVNNLTSVDEFTVDKGIEEGFSSTGINEAQSLSKCHPRGSVVEYG
ncbi:hypothetical protein Scep_016244 [Stephania cephalantha]|uniref:DUF674 domain-containing protein n=1 Tax=Stephania cephalantha TaxID=152367 RepID=A0AAP0NVL5_9MAGN